MLREEAVFVVGAGASAEYKLPVGFQLQKNIARWVDFKFEYGGPMKSGDPELWDIIRRIGGAGRDLDSYQAAGRRIAAGISLSNSIDNFMDKHHDDRFVATLGRLGIAKGIVQAEHRSPLRVDTSNIYNRLQFDAVESTWLSQLFRYMQEDVRRSDVDEFFNKASFIIFNYDRCVEHFFVHGLMANFAIDLTKAASLVGGARFIHPYGTIGALPCCAQANELALEYGDEGGPLREMAGRIRTYADQIEDSEALAKLRDLAAQASTICFLGFSYQRQNLDLITPAFEKRRQRIIGSAYGLSDFDVKAIQRDLLTRFGTTDDKATIDNRYTCGDLFNHYSRAFRQ